MRTLSIGVIGFALVVGQPTFGGALVHAQTVSSGVASASPILDAGGTWRQGRSAALLAVLDEHVEWILAREPLDATQRGDERFSRQLADVSPAATARRLAEVQDRLRRLRSLDHAAFTEQDRLDADLLRYELEQDIEEAPFHREQLLIDARSGPQVWLAQMPDRLPMATAQQREDYSYRLEAVARHVDQHIEQLRLGLAAGRVPPKAAMAGTVEQCLMLASEDIAQTPSLSPFFKPFRGLPESDPGVSRAREAIRSAIVPAFNRLGVFLRDEYLPKCRDSVSYSQGVDGVAAYNAALRSHTTLPLTSDEIHRLGLSEVERIRSEMMSVIARTDFSRKDEFTNADDLYAAFLSYLRTDPRFYYTTPEDLLSGYREISKRIDAELPRLFSVLPRTPYGVRELPALTAPTSPTAYYYRGSLKSGVPGWFMANTYRLDQRPKYEMVALTLHEAVPGHHLQVALAQELEGQHPFRTFGGYTAFVEGWALYAERLGLEVGDADLVEGRNGTTEVGRHMYSDPYDDFGRLSYEMWRAARLVVDTGIHAKGWSRQQAIDFMLAQTSLSAHNIEREVDRYIAWPGQACAYKIGELKIRELRSRAEKSLGGRFDRRKFHDAVLGSGAIPLPTLEARIDRWISEHGSP